MIPYSAKLEDAVTGQRLLKAKLKELLLRDIPKLTECIDWDVFGEHYASLLCEPPGIVEAEPQDKRPLNFIDL
jgi:hypothetical protein